MSALADLAVPAGFGSARLRILGYHDVVDAALLRSQLEWLGARFNFVTPARAVEILCGRDKVEKAVLVTFDDGDPSVVLSGRPVLDDLGISAVMFVCPGVVGTSHPFWWQVVEQAVRVGLPMAQGTDVASLKAMVDEERRAVVTELDVAIQEMTGFAHEQAQLTVGQMETWVSKGHVIGNHTWDHPILDRCTARQQRDQIVRSHDWLKDLDLMQTATFAYPNGNMSLASKEVLADLGYEVAYAFDHRMARAGQGLAVSRLRVNADDPLTEFIAKASGIHPLAHRLSGRS